MRVLDCVNVTMSKYTRRQSLYVDERDLAPGRNSCSLNATQVAPMNACCRLVSNGCIKQIYGCVTHGRRGGERQMWQGRHHVGAKGDGIKAEKMNRA